MVGDREIDSYMEYYKEAFTPKLSSVPLFHITIPSKRGGITRRGLIPAESPKESSFGEAGVYLTNREGIREVAAGMDRGWFGSKSPTGEYLVVEIVPTKVILDPELDPTDGGIEGVQWYISLDPILPHQIKRMFYVKPQ